MQSGLLRHVRCRTCSLLASRAPVETEIARTHSGLISAFSLHLVKTGRVSDDLGKTLNKAEDLRLIADYKGDLVEPEHARWAVKGAGVFVEAIQKEFFQDKQPTGLDASQTGWETTYGKGTDVER